MKNQSPHFSIGEDHQVFFRNPNQGSMATSFHPLLLHVTTVVVGQWSPSPYHSFPSLAADRADIPNI